MRAPRRLTNLFKRTPLSRLLSLGTASAVALAVLLASPALTARSRGRSAPSQAAGPAPGGTASQVNTSAQKADPSRTQQRLESFDQLINKAEARGPVRVIVGLRSDFAPEGQFADALGAGRRAELKKKQDSLLSRLSAFAPRGVKQFRTIPYMAMTVGGPALEFMKTSAEVETIREDGINMPTLAESREVVGARLASDVGFSGQGQVIAVLDTGVDKDHPFLSGKVISEACFSSSYNEEMISSVCPGGGESTVEESTAPGSGQPCKSGDPKDCGHGTHVAGIAAGRSPSGSFQGVAKEADLVSIQVASLLNSPDVCGVDENGKGRSPCTRIFDSDYMLGLEHVLVLRLGGMNIAAANLSVGTFKGYAERCDKQFPDIKKLIDLLQSVGVATIASSGNGDEKKIGYPNALTAPACISSSIRVGSVGDGSPKPVGGVVAQRDAVSSFSNGAPFLTLLAPGEWITSSLPNGASETMYGTSMAAPHVAAAWAILKQAAPGASVAQVLAALKNTGQPVTDRRTGVVIPRINIDRALGALPNCGYALSSGGVSVTATGDVGAFGVAAPAGCPWAATSHDPWISTDSAGSGSGTVVFTVGVNTGAARAGAISVGGQTFVVQQAAGCNCVSGQFKMTAVDGLAKDQFGHSVAVSGDTAVVGAPRDNMNGIIDRGSAYVFVRVPNGAWALQAKLFPPDGGPGDEFGSSVAIDGDTVVVGAKSHAVGARPNQGAAYVFVRSGDTWSLQEKLVSPADTQGAVVDDNFGGSVAVYGNRVVVGAPGFEIFSLSGILHVGAAYIFERSGTVWTRQTPHIQGLLPAKLGESVATADFTIQGVNVSAVVLGLPITSPGSTAGSPPSRYGAVQFYVRSSGSTAWTLQPRIYAADPAHGDRFGDSVAMTSDGTTVVGSPMDDTGVKVEQGSAYILTPTLGPGGVRWRQQAKLVADDAAGMDEFGSSVGIFGNTVVVGAPNDEVEERLGQGSAYVFERSGSTWTQRRKLLADDGTSSDSFGVSVGLSDGAAVVGTVGAAPGHDRKGAAYIYSPVNAVPTSTVQLNSAAVSVDESARKVTVTVARTGGTAAPASVDFATGGGSADGRRDYTQTLGTLHFGVGETAKTVTVFVTDDVMPESPETFIVSLSNPVGTAIGARGSTVVTINSNDASVGPNPVDRASFNPEFFVRQHYVDFLNREPDAAGLRFWADNFTPCGGDPQCIDVRKVYVSAAFFLSIEFQETGYLVYRMYKAAYGDALSPAVAGTVPAVRLGEFLPDTQSIGRGVQVGVGDWPRQLESNKNAYALDFVQSPRFLASFPATMSPTLYVDWLNQNAGWVLSPGERAQLIAELTANNTAQGRASALRRVAEDVDLRDGELRRAFVLMQYFGYLRRNPDDPQDTNFGGWKFWLDKLNQFGGNYVDAEMVKAFIESIEYKNRFGQ